MAHLVLAAFKREEGQGLAEYALILALIAMVAIVALAFFGTSLGSYLQMIASSI
jgi:pilus assembly protein Flp/PilA